MEIRTIQFQTENETCLDNNKTYNQIELKEVDGVIIRNWVQNGQKEHTDTHTSLQNFEKWWNLPLNTIHNGRTITKKTKHTIIE